MRLTNYVTKWLVCEHHTVLASPASDLKSYTNGAQIGFVLKN